MPREFTLLVITADRPAQLACCLTSLFDQVSYGTVLELWDNGKVPVIQDDVARGVIVAAQEVRGWELHYRLQEPDENEGVLYAEGANNLVPEGLVLWTDDDCLWRPGAVSHLLDALKRYRAVEPVVVDLFDRGFPDFTGLERIAVEEGEKMPAPARHLYKYGTKPFETDFLSSILLCRAADLVGVWKEIPVSSDMVSTCSLPGPKAIVPRAECLHMAHTRQKSDWMRWSVPRMWREGYAILKEREVSGR